MLRPNKLDHNQRLPWAKRWRRRAGTIVFWIVIFGMLWGLGLWINPPKPGEALWWPQAAVSEEATSLCTELINRQGEVSSQDWQWLMSIELGSAQREVRSTLGPPYCKLPALYIGVNQRADRHVYRFKPGQQRWLIVLYEDEQYMGYGVVRE